jgi:hypothetical protein
MMTRRDIASDVYALGLKRALSQRGNHPQAQAIPDVFGDLFTAWLSNPSANARSLKEEAGYLVWHARQVLDGARYSSAVRRSMSIATPSGKTSYAVGSASMPVDEVLDLTVFASGVTTLTKEQALADVEAARRRTASIEKWQKIKAAADALVEKAKKATEDTKPRRRSPSAVAAFKALQCAKSQAEAERILGCDYKLAQRLAELARQKALS